MTPFRRSELDTPALVIDRATLERNIAAMAAFARSHGMALRPHAKTHKSAEIARLQMAAGAVGICCAKLGEAEALADAGIADIHLTSPVATPSAIARLASLNRRISLSVVVDNPANAGALARAIDASLTVFIDVDPGNFRTGVASADAAVELAEIIAAAPTLRLGGVQFYCGSQQHILAFADRHKAISEKTAYLKSVIAALAAAGHVVPVITGGGTGTFAIDAELGVLTELQVGSYTVMDREYADCETAPDQPAFEQALFIDTTVVSANAQDRVTVDAGLKAIAGDAGPPTICDGAPAGAVYKFTGDEHGAIMGDGALPPVGSRVTLRPGHCDPTINLYDVLNIVEGDLVTARWTVDARGKST